MKRILLKDLADAIKKGSFRIDTQYCWKCNKVLYTTREEASLKASKIAKAGKGKSRPYQCTKMYGWHLTSRIQSKYKPNKHGNFSRQ